MKKLSIFNLFVFLSLLSLSASGKNIVSSPTTIKVRPDTTPTGRFLTTNGSDTDTQAKVDSALNGDTVILPDSGTFNWSRTVKLPATKYITLDLNGSAVKLTSSAKITLEAHATGSNRVTNGSIVRADGSDQYNGVFFIRDERGKGSVIADHLDISGNGNTLVSINGRGPGLMHHCTFHDLGWAQEFIHIDGWGPSSEAGWTNDTSATLAGSGGLFYIEDNSFSQTKSQQGVAWIQAYYGSRVAIRHNTFNWVSVDMHGTAGNIGARWWEMYENKFNNNVGSGQPSWAFSFRAGSGVIFNNSMATGAGHAVSIGLCEEDSGYPAKYQIGRGINQSLDPAYVWNNGTIKLSVGGCDAPGVNGMVQLNRDVFSSKRPAYVPYTYPHPGQAKK